MTEVPEILYFCPASREIESAVHGGFTRCCNRPQDHVPMPDTPGTTAVAEALSTAVKERFKLSEQLAELNHAIMWETTCLNCSSMLTRSYEDCCRADRAESMLRVARFTADHWREQMLRTPGLEAAAHACAMILIALDGQTDPVECGISEEGREGFLAAVEPVEGGAG